METKGKILRNPQLSLFEEYADPDLIVGGGIMQFRPRKTETG